MARNHRNAERNGCRAAIEPKVRQIAICGHLDPQVFLEVVVSQISAPPCSHSMLDRRVAQAPGTDESVGIPCAWRHGRLAFCLCESGNQAHGVQRVGGRWEASHRASAGSRERCNSSTLVEIKGRASEHCASEPSTAGRSRVRTNEHTCRGLECSSVKDA